MKVIDIWINCPDRATAEAISRKLLSEHIVACANIFQDISSAYHWQGEIETATEIPLLVKTRDALFDVVCQTVTAMHPYDVPGITAVALEFVNEDYRNWVYAETESGDTDKFTS